MFWRSLIKKNRQVIKVISYEGLNLPSSRSNQGLNLNEEYIQSGVQQISFLNENNLLGATTRILDFGCGQGRLANALTFLKTPYLEYTGVDTNKESIAWCNKNINYNDKLRFIHLPAYNARYNKNVEGLKPLPIKNNTFDLIFLNSVFSHMLQSDILFYLGEFYNVLKNDGRIYLTAFIEEEVPDAEENPENYLGQSSGALHRVRYEKYFFTQLINQCNFELEKFHYRFIKRTNQSVLVLKKSIISG